MAGIGPVTTNLGDLIRRAGVRPGISDPKNELEIFCSLCVGRVYYRDENHTLYFVDSPALSISLIVEKVFAGLAQTPRIQQLYMEQHKLFQAALCIQLTEAQRKALFTAFALSGIHIKRSRINDGNSGSERPEIQASPVKVGA
ncbi:MAG: hypothetical protein OEN02_05915 [Gammaproteobacteria bacterium]|nr:hypothetical protein [Gammaproteobacteria bacterium]